MSNPPLVVFNLLILSSSLIACGGGGGGGGGGGAGAGISSQPAPSPVSSNQTPTANSFSIDADEGLSTSIQLSGGDADGDTITYVITSNPSFGDLQLDGVTGISQYTPQLGSPASDSFSYATDDGTTRSEAATVSIIINRTPMTKDLEVKASEVSPYAGYLEASDPDGDELTFSVVSTTSDGQFTLLDAATGQFEYRANNPSSGSDTLVYQVGDGRLMSQSGQVSFSVVRSQSIFESQIIKVDACPCEKRLIGDSVAATDSDLILGGGSSGLPTYVFNKDASGAWIEGQHIGTRFKDLGLSGGTFVGGKNGYATTGVKQLDGEWLLDGNLIEPNPPVENDYFGEYVDFYGDYCVISARSGSYVFRRNSQGGWVQEANFSRHGKVAMGTELAAVSGQDVVFVFRRETDGNWTEEAMIVPDSPGETFGSSFGQSLDLDGNRLIVGAQRESHKAIHDPEITDDEIGAGAAYLFERDDQGQWTQVWRFTASDRGRMKEFGRNVSLDDGIIVVSDRESILVGKKVRFGTAYVYTEDADGNWFERAKMKSSQEYDTRWGLSNFGSSMDSYGNAVFVGAPEYPLECVRPEGGSCPFPGRGVVYVFDMGPALTP